MATTKAPTPAAAAAEAAQAVVDAREVLNQWQTRLAAAADAVTTAEAVSGDELLDDPPRAAGWPAHLRELRDQVEVTSRSLAAQEQRVRAAELAWLAAAARVVEVDEVIPARKALEAHQARTAELLAALEQHDGPYVPQHRLASAQRASGVIVQYAVEWRMPKSVPLQRALARAEVRHSVLAAMAKGDDPTVLVAGRQYATDIAEGECYPDGVGPAGLVPAPVFAGRAESARALVAELEQLPAELERDIRDCEERAIREQWEPEVLKAAVERRRARIDEVPAELETAREQLAAVTGAV